MMIILGVSLYECFGHVGLNLKVGARIGGDVPNLRIRV